MLLNEPTPHHQTRPAAAARTHELPAVEVDGASGPPRDPGGATPTRANANDPTVGIEVVDGSDAIKTVALDVEGVKRALAEGISASDATATVSLNIAAVRRAMAAEGAAESGDDAAESAVAGEGSGDSAADEIENADSDAEPGAEALAADEFESADSEAGPGAAAESFDRDSFSAAEAELGAEALAADEFESTDSEAGPGAEAESFDRESSSALVVGSEAEPESEAAPDSDAAADSAAGPSSVAETDLPAGIDSDTEDSSPESSAAPDTVELSADTDSPTTDLVPSTGDAVDTLDIPTATYLVSTDLSTPTSTLVAVPETADDVIATIHAAATAVAAADRRARQAAVVKDDPWTGLDLHQPAVPAPVDNVLDLLSPILERPLLVVEQPGLPQAADVVALHRSELETDFVEPPVVAAGAEPPIPPRYGPGLSVLPHIEFPV